MNRKVVSIIFLNRVDIGDMHFYLQIYGTQIFAFFNNLYLLYLITDNCQPFNFNFPKIKHKF